MDRLTGSNDAAPDAAAFAGPYSIGLDFLPSSLRMLIEQQSCIAGHDIGRCGSDYIHDHDGSMGEESAEQKRKRKKRLEELWQSILSDPLYRNLYMQIIESLTVSQIVIAVKRENIARELAGITEAQARLDGDESGWSSRIREDLQQRKEVLHAQIEEINRHEKEVLQPVAKAISTSTPPSKSQIQQMAQTTINSVATVSNPYYPPSSAVIGAYSASPIAAVSAATAAVSTTETEKKGEGENENPAASGPPRIDPS
jgi:hypothetical protein